MRIAIIGQKGIPAKDGGVERQVERLALDLVKLGQDVLVYNRKNYLPEKIKEYQGVKLVTLPFLNTKNLANITHNFLAVIDLCFRKVDIVHFHGIGPSLLIFILKIFKPKVKVVATLHSFDYDNDKWGGFAKRMLKLGEKLMFKMSDKVIVLNENTQNYVKNKYKKEAVIIPNGVEILENVGANLLNNWDLKEKEYIISVSRLIKLKGIQYLIKAFKDIKTDMKLVIVGDGEYKHELEKMAGSDKRIIFTNNQTSENLKQLFANAALFVQSSKMEGLSISLLEAMSLSLPCLVSDIEANLKVVNNKGLVFKSESVASLKEELEKFLEYDKEKLEKISKDLKDEILSKYEAKEIAKKTLFLYKNLT